MHHLAPYKVIACIGIGRKKPMQQTMAHDVRILCDAEEFAAEMMGYGGWKQGDTLEILGKNEKVIHRFERGRHRWHCECFAGKMF